MSASIGVAICPRGAQTAEQLLRDADTALYTAKRRGRNRLERFNEELHAHVARRLRIETDLRDYLRGIEHQLVREGVTVSSEVRFGRPAEEIIAFANDLKIELIAMSTHGRSGLARWAYGSVADRVLHAARCPVLLVRAK